MAGRPCCKRLLGCNRSQSWPVGAGDGMRSLRALLLAQPSKTLAMLTLILFLAGLVCFYIFFKTIDYFEKI
jgi:hypothetical protein